MGKDNQYFFCDYEECVVLCFFSVYYGCSYCNTTSIK